MSTASRVLSNVEQSNATSRIARDLLLLNNGSAANVLVGSAAGSSKALTLNAGVSSFNASSAGSAQIVQSFAASGAASASAAASGSVAASGSNAVYLSQIEQAILRAQAPIEINETEEITVNNERGVWANRAEVINWKGIIPITEYLINEDANPEIITKKVTQQIEYIQELAIRYLRPPTPPAPGEIIIKQEINSLTPPAPPLIIRQQPARADTPEPLVIREAPPQPPAQVGRKIITISGKRIPPPPRKVIIERLPAIPGKPQSVLIERWLPYAQVKRRVIFQRSNEKDAVVVKPRNVIVQWEAPQVNIRKEVKYLGVIQANPVEYVQRYGAELKIARDLPVFVTEIKTPDGLVLAADYKYNSLHELEGDIQAFKLVDLDKEGLAEYRAYLANLGISYQPGAAVSSSFSASAAAAALASSSRAAVSAAQSFKASSSSSAVASVAAVSANLASVSKAAVSSGIIQQIFNSINRDDDTKISIEEAEKVLLRLNSRLGRQYGEDDVKSFFSALDSNNDGYIEFEDFKKAFANVA